MFCSFIIKILPATNSGTLPKCNRCRGVNRDCDVTTSALKHATLSTSTIKYLWSTIFVWVFLCLIIYDVTWSIWLHNAPHSPGFRVVLWLFVYIGIVPNHCLSKGILSQQRIRHYDLSKYSASSINRPPINRPGSTGRYIQLFSLKSTRFTVEKN